MNSYPHRSHYNGKHTVLEIIYTYECRRREAEKRERNKNGEEKRGRRRRKRVVEGGWKQRGRG